MCGTQLTPWPRVVLYPGDAQFLVLKLSQQPLTGEAADLTGPFGPTWGVHASGTQQRAVCTAV